MSSELYQVFALGMRYWFALLGLIITVIAYFWLVGEHRRRHRRLHDLPDAGLAGDLKVLEECGDLQEGMTIPLPYEGTLGCLRTCDMTIPCDGVAPEHLDLCFRRGLGLLVMPRRGMTCVADGEELTCRSKPREHVLHHGSILEVGDVKLRVRLFAGLETAGYSHMMTDSGAASLSEDTDPVPEPLSEIQTPETEQVQLPMQTVSQAVPRRDWNAGSGQTTVRGYEPAARNEQPAVDSLSEDELNNSRRIAALFGPEENDRYRRSTWRRNDEEQE